MKTVKKHKTFEELKASEQKPKDYKESIKKHNVFKKMIEGIYAVKEWVGGSLASFEKD